MSELRPPVGAIEPDDHADHDHAGHDHADHDHAGHEHGGHGSTGGLDGPAHDGHAHDGPAHDGPAHGGHDGHSHGVSADADRRYLFIALGLLVGFMVLEVIVAFLSHSLALLS